MQVLLPFVFFWWFVGCTTATPGLATNRTDVSTKRKLRASKTAVESNEERLVPQVLLEMTGPSKTQDLVVGKTKQEIFNMLQSHKTDPLKTLESPWKAIILKKLFPTKDSTNLIQLFKTKYEEDALINALLVAKKSTKSVVRSTAESLLNQQLEEYLAKGWSPIRVFKELNIPTDQLVFSHPKLMLLEEYITLFNSKKSSEETVSLIQVLTSVWEDEGKLLKSVVTAKANPSTESKALEVEDALITKWSEKDVHPSSLLDQFKVPQQVNALSSEFLRPTMKYISKYNQKHAGKEFSLVTWLTKTVEENVLAEALVKAKKIDATKEIATALQMEQFEHWSQVQDPLDSAYKTLHMRGFEGRKVQVLEDFIAFYNKKKSRDETLLNVLTSAFDDEIKFLKTLVRANADSFTKEKALEVEKALHEKWSNDNWHPRLLLAKLDFRQRLNEQDFTYMKTAMKYISHYNKKHPDSAFSLVKWFPETEQHVLAETLIEAKRVAATKEFATALQVEQFETWIQSKEPFEDVITMLKLRSFDGRKVQVLDDFIAFYNIKKSSDETLLDVLTSFFGDELKLTMALQQAKTDVSSAAKMLEVEQLLIEKLLTENVHPSDLLRRFNIEPKVEALQVASLDTVWQYIEYYNEKHANKKFSLVTWFTKAIEEDVLAQALVKATKVEETKELATALQMEQLENWLEAQMSIDEIWKVLKLDDLGSNVASSPKFETLKKYIALVNARNPGNEKVDISSVLRQHNIAVTNGK